MLIGDKSGEVGREAGAAFHRQIVSPVSFVSADMFSPGPSSGRLLASYCAPARGASSLMPASANHTQARSAVEQRGLSTWSKAALHQLSATVNLRTATAVVRAGPGPLRRLANNAGIGGSSKLGGAALGGVAAGRGEGGQNGNEGTIADWNGRQGVVGRRVA